MSSHSFTTALARIKLLVLDVDRVLTDGRLYYGSDGGEVKVFNVRDGLGIKMLMSSGVDVAIITARASEIVTRRAGELGIDHCHQGSDNKLRTLDKLLKDLNLEYQHAAYMGDDLPDLEAMRQVGVALTVADACTEVMEAAAWCSSRAGGDGAVREACEAIMSAQNTLVSTQTLFTGDTPADPG